MSLVECVAVLVAGVVAGAVNTVVGAGTLLTFPLLVAVGVPPLTANVSNSVGLIPAAATGAWGLRREVAGSWRTIARMATLSAVGGVVGGGLLLWAPGAFRAVVPWLLVLAAALAAAQPRISEALRRRDEAAFGGAGPTAPRTGHAATRRVGPALAAGIVATGVYGGYFGAAQGVVLLALLGAAWSADLHRANGAKVVLAGVAQVVAGCVFVATGVVDWGVTATLAAGSAVGGLLGAPLARRIPAGLLRALIVIAGVGAAVALWVRA